VFAIVAVLSFSGALKQLEDWRWAAVSIRSMRDEQTAVFMHPALVESQQLDWFADPERTDYLLSPASYYDFGGPVIPVPYDISPESQAFLTGELDALSPDTNRIVYLTRFPSIPFRAWLEGALESQGWSEQRVGVRGNMLIVEFVRDDVTP
jgi:hypothetical protein